MPLITEAEFIELMKAEILILGSQGKFAEACDEYQPDISSYISGRKPPSKKVREYFGAKLVKLYEI